MPINLSKAKEAIENYRAAHALIYVTYSDYPSWQISDMHDPLTNAMREETAKWGFAHEDDVFKASDMEALNGMGYSSREDFFNTVYDADGNVISGKESNHNTWEARWK